ncbi:protein FAR1-RELATED SEQUENCE 5-like [Helianthus annuus]|uniref:protein FAR1-RELATED SEQUENCE 5-like n=1 Tax=Helianthus annuus TaxID=4232 RepID=UPI000B8F684E|nr:protein FAR1-RELATED SEQUENCE 5-like [Helianthus annuus]
MEELSGLMRTTWMSNSKNHFFGQVCNAKSTLVEFMTHYETAIERQRHTHQRNDHESRYKRPQLKSNYKVFESQAAAVIYTKNIFCDIQAELIGIGDCLNQHYEEQPDGFVKFYINDFQQPCKSLFEVMYRKSDCTSTCSCRRFEQFGLLCIFYVLRSQDIKEFPKQCILNRCRKEASPNCSSDHSMSRDFMTELDPDVQNKRFVAPPPSTRDRFAEITGQYQNDKNLIRVPVGSKSKVSRSCKRLKSKQEEAIEKIKTKGKPRAKERQCKNCKAFVYYAYTCKKAHVRTHNIENKTESSINDVFPSVAFELFGDLN